MNNSDLNTVSTADIEKNKDVSDNFSKQSTLFTKREWIMRYASPFKALMFMAGPMVIIMLVNSLYGIIDKQLALNFAIDNVLHEVQDGTITGYVWMNGKQILIDATSVGDPSNWSAAGILFAKQLINVSTQYSNTLITLLSAMSLLTAVGTAIKWGQAMGARDKERMDSILITGLIQTLIISVIGILILHFVGPYIIMAQTGKAYSEREVSLIFSLSNQYTQTFIYGFPLLAVGTFISTLIRTEGKVWWVIVFNLVAIGLNILSGELLMEAAPAAEKMQAAVYGSFIAWSFTIVSGLILISVSKNTLLFPKFKGMKLKLRDAADIWINGVSPFLANVIFAVSNFITTYLITIAHTNDIDNLVKNVIAVKGQINGVTDVMYISPTLRVMSSGFPWLNILYAPIIGMMEGANANYAYCKGAEKRYRMLQIWRIHLAINLIWGVFCLILIAAAGGPMMEAFDGPAELKWWFFAFVCGIVFVAFTYTALSLFQGIGDALDATLIAIFRSLMLNISFVVIGWAIAKNISTTWDHDWVIFLMSGLCEIPAAGITYLLVRKLFKKWIKAYQLNDKADQFDAPSLLTAAENEITMSVAALTNRANKIYGEKIKKATDKFGANSSRVQILEDKRDLELERILYNSRIKRKKVEDTHRFDNLTFGKDNRDRKFKMLEQKYNKEVFKVYNNMSFDKEQQLIDVENTYNIKREKAAKNIEKNDAYYEKLRSGELHLTPEKLFFIKVEPQPLRDADSRNSDKKDRHVIIR